MFVVAVETDFHLPELVVVAAAEYSVAFYYCNFYLELVVAVVLDFADNKHTIGIKKDVRKRIKMIKFSHLIN